VKSKQKRILGLGAMKPNRKENKRRIKKKDIAKKEN